MSTSMPASLKPPAAVPMQALDAFTERAAAAGRQALGVVAIACGAAITVYRRWDAHQERLLRQAAERDNVHLLFPRV